MARTPIPRPIRTGDSEPVVAHGIDGTPLTTQTITVLASAARTADTNSDTLVNPGFPGVRVRVNVTAITATPSVVATIQEYESIGGNWINILASAAITATGRTVLIVHPGCVAVANRVVNEPMPRTWRVNMDHDDADSITYSVDADYTVG